MLDMSEYRTTNGMKNLELYWNFVKFKYMVAPKTNTVKIAHRIATVNRKVVSMKMERALYRDAKLDGKELTAMKVKYIDVQLECSANKFGVNCTFTCHCHDGSCNRSTGFCHTPGCKAGWKGDNCSTSCDSNHYEFGMDCNSTCHCLNGSCNRTFGDCDMPGCKDGWQGTTCSSPCISNTFGFECNSTCHCKEDSCDNTDGQCFKSGCKPGWKEKNCSIHVYYFTIFLLKHKKECDDNTFGQDCKHTCYCLNGTCDKITGICDIPGCKPVYQGETCSSVCDNDFFGSNCSSKCFCKAGTYNSVTGKCKNGMCRDGYIGETCTKNSTLGPSTGIIAGVVSAGVVVAVMVIVLLLYIKQRRITKNKQNNRNYIDGRKDLNAGFSDLSVNVDNGPKNQMNVEVNEIEYANLEPRSNTNRSIKELKTRLLKSSVKEELGKEYEV
ncbi:hypothetical protein KUTeg_000929 [Tegillarca granosa]|uniref:Uncharacterized protein n=1 Tax=Tegillarca granosa TaxID=220873 RepID=A0ABQ9FW84_TEGGR|nr:hypothetical protein KUTeg_000929 [Tegillarca granosa]